MIKTKSGLIITVKPTKWWSLKSRRTAREMEKFMAHLVDVNDIAGKAIKAGTNVVIYGNPEGRK